MSKLIIFTLLLSNLAFGENSKHKHHEMNQSHSDKKMGKMHGHNDQNKDFNKVLMKYEDLHQAFFDNKKESIKSSAKELLERIESIQDEKISKTLTYTKKKLSEIITSDDMKSSKEAMNTVSQGLLVVLEKHAPNKSYARYYCPMVKKYWIQNITDSEKVMNPYASSSMPHCGAKK